MPVIGRQLLLIALWGAQKCVSEIPVPKKFLVIIPGFGGHPTREAYIRQSLQLYPADNWDCVLFVYNSNTHSGHQMARRKSNSSLPCEWISSPGKFVDHLLHVRPEFVIRRKYKLIVVHVDDAVFMPPLEFSWEAIHHFMTTAAVDSVSPRVHQAGLVRLMNPLTNSSLLSAACPGLYPTGSCGWMGYEVPQVEIFVQVFLPLAWICFWDMLDAGVNNEGWGYDVCFKQVCNVSIALLDHWHVVHTRPNGSRTDGREAMVQMDQLFKNRERGQDAGRNFFLQSCVRSKVDYTSY